MDDLVTDLLRMRTELDLQIDAVMAEAAGMGIEATQLRLPNGSWPIADLLVAKASVLVAIANVRKTNDGN